MDQIAKGENITIDPNGQPLAIQIVIGGSTPASYSSYLICGGSHTQICKGRSDQPVKKCPIDTSPSTLSGQMVSWQVGAAPESNTFTIVVTLFQGQNELKSYTYTGQRPDFLADYVSLVSA